MGHRGDTRQERPSDPAFVLQHRLWRAMLLPRDACEHALAPKGERISGKQMSALKHRPTVRLLLVTWTAATAGPSLRCAPVEMTEL